MNDEMTLAEWVAEEHKRIGVFVAWWNQQHAAEPDHYPLSLSPALWAEMFVDFEIEEQCAEAAKIAAMQSKCRDIVNEQ